MELNEFIANFAEQFDDTDASEIQASTDDDGHIRRDDYLYMEVLLSLTSPLMLFVL